MYISAVQVGLLLWRVIVVSGLRDTVAVVINATVAAATAVNKTDSTEILPAEASC